MSGVFRLRTFCVPGFAFAGSLPPMSAKNYPTPGVITRSTVVFIALLVATRISSAQTPTSTFTPVTPTANPYIYSWSTAANWDTPPTATGNADTVLQFNDTGAQTYNASNDFSGTYQLNG